MMSFIENITKYSEDSPNKIAIYYRNQELSYRTLYYRASILAKFLIDRGMKNKKIAFYLPNCLELVYCYLACLIAGVVMIPLNHRYKAKELQHVLIHAEADWLISCDEKLCLLLQIDFSATTISKRILVGDTISSEYTPFQECMTGSPIISQQLLVDNSLAILFYTSGSTGNPKGVMHSYASLQEIFHAFITANEIQADTIYLGCESLAHIGAFSFLFANLINGATIILQESFDEEDYIALVEKYHPTLLTALTSRFIELLNNERFCSLDFTTLKFAITGGDYVSPELEDRFQAVTKKPLLQNYGMTELGLITAKSIHSSYPYKSIGKALPGIQIKLLDNKGTLVANTEIGAAYVKSASMTSGYWQNLDSTKTTIEDGWFKTGDLLSCDDNGFYYYHGRSKHIIICGGSNIFPEEIEEVLLQHPAIQTAFINAKKHAILGEVPRAFIVLKKHFNLSEQDLKFYLDDKIADYKIPQEFIFMDTLPLNAVGKIDKNKLHNFIS